MPNTETHLQHMVEELKLKVLNMSALAERAVDQACTALIRRDADLAEKVIENDTAINSLECEIDEASLQILAREQPVARDLRLVMACARSVVDLERIGDEAVNIAERVVAMSALAETPYNPDLEALADTVRGMLRNAVTAFRNGDDELALAVCRSDGQADELHVRILRRTMDDMVAETTGIRRAVHTILAARSLERIGDLCTNVAEVAVFMVRGVSIKHRCHQI